MEDAIPERYSSSDWRAAVDSKVSDPTYRMEAFVLPSKR